MTIEHHSRPAHALRLGLLTNPNAAVAVVLLVPLIQILAQPSWIYTPDGFDQWFYHGYFIDLKSHVAAFAGSYYGTRLAWILPGYLAHSIFPTLLANAALRLVVCWTAVLSTFFLIRRTYGTRCALLVTLLLSSYPVFLAAAGWDYVDGAGIAYSLLCMEEAGAAAVSSSRWGIARAVFSGMAFGAAVHSNIFLLVLLPVMSLYCLVRAGIRFVRIALAGVAGFSALTIALGLISLKLGGPFLFFLPSVSAARSLGTAPNPSYSKPALWLSHAWWLVIPSAVLFVSIVFLIRFLSSVRSGWDRKAIVRLVDAGLLASSFTILIILQATGSPVLQIPYYADYLTAFVAVTAAALIGYKLESLSISRVAFVIGACIVLAFLVGTEIPRLFPTSIAADYVALRGRPDLNAEYLAAIVAVGVLVAVCLRPQIFAGVLMGVAVGFVLIRLGHIELRESVGSKTSREAYLYTDRTSRELTRLSRNGPLWFWYSYSPGNEYYTSVASTYIWAARLLNRTFPDTTNLRLDALGRGTYVAIMNDRQTTQDEGITALARCGVKVRQVKRLTSTIGTAKLLINLVQVTKRETAPTVYTSSPAEATLLSSRELMDYDAPALAAHTSRIRYGHSSQNAVPEPPWIVKSTDPRDHAATDFQALAPSDGIVAIRVTVVDQRAEDPFGPVNLILQNQDYSVLYASGTLLGKRSDIVALSPTTRQIRIALLPNDSSFIRFPERVTLEGLRLR